MLTFTVPGTPQPQGSTRTFVVNGKAVTTSANPKLRPWRAEFIDRAQAVENRANLHDVPVTVHAYFYFPHPRSHYGTGRNAGTLKPNATIWKAGKPDVDKLLRAVCDGLVQAGIIRDDAQVVGLHGSKWYGAEPRTDVGVQNATYEVP